MAQIGHGKCKDLFVCRPSLARQTSQPSRLASMLHADRKTDIDSQVLGRKTPGLDGSDGFKIVLCLRYTSCPGLGKAEFGSAGSAALC